MPRMSINVSTEAYTRLKKLKLPGESFSDVILRELPEKWETCGDVLEGLSQMNIPEPNPKLLKAMLEGRGRRSNRK